MERGREGTGGELVSDRQTMRDSLRWSRTVETTQQEDQSKGRLSVPLSMNFWKSSKGGGGSFPIQKISLQFFLH